MPISEISTVISQTVRRHFVVFPVRLKMLTSVARYRYMTKNKPIHRTHVVQVDGVGAERSDVRGTAHATRHYHGARIIQDNTSEFIFKNVQNNYQNNKNKHLLLLIT